MSGIPDEAGPSRIKRKISDPDVGYGESKCKAEDLSLTSFVSDVHEESSENDSATKFGDYLSAQYEILLRVLSNLSAYDLRSAARVSKAWLSASRVVQESRNQFHWLFWHANNKGWNVPPPLAIYTSIIEHVYSQPTKCIAFFTKNARKSFECSSPDIVCPATRTYKCCGKLHPIESYMSSSLGPSCEILSLTVSGIVGTSSDLKSTFEVEYLSKGKVQSMSAALFPNCPGIKIERFRLTRNELLMGIKQHTAGELDLASRLGLPDDLLIQAIVLFSGSRIRGDEVSMFVACLQARQDHSIAVAGGIDEKPDKIEGLIILGDNVCAASVVIPEPVTEKDVLVEYITRIKNCNLPTHQAFCFMFTCLGRGTIWYDGDKDVESSTIKNIFPKSPVIGFFGQGEIGVNSLPGFESHDSDLFWRNFKAMCAEKTTSLKLPPKVVKRGELSVDHSYSMCLLYLSFNTANSHLAL